MASRFSKLKAKHSGADVVIVSFPKSGRTWVRYFIGKYLELAYEKDFSMDLDMYSDLPKVLITHNYFDIYQDVEGDPRVLFPDILRSKPLIVIVRDPRDVGVSYYHQKKSREGVFQGEIGDFLKSKIYGIERQSRFVLELLKFTQRGLSSRIIDKIFRREPTLISYEMMKENTYESFRSILKYIYGGVNESALREAIKLSSFDMMREEERRNPEGEGENRLGGATANKNSLKVRRGKVGGFKDEISSELLRWIGKSKYTKELISILSNVK